MRHYDRIAELYDRQYAEEQTSKIRVALQVLEQKPSGFVLDVGCGTGLLFNHVKTQAKLLVGVDVSRRILEVAKRRARGNGNIELIQADADYLPFPKQLFDIAFAVTLIQNMPRPTRTLKEVREITKPGGRIVLTAIRKGYTKKSLAGIIQNAGLEIKEFCDDPCLKGYVAACTGLSPT